MLMRQRRYFPVLVFFLFFLTADLLANSAKASAQHALYTQAVQVTQPECTQYQQVIRATGEIAPWETVVISSETGGLQITEMSVQPGDAVRAGQVLASLEDRFLRFERDQLAAQEQAARVALQQASKNADRARALQATAAMSEQQITAILAGEQSAEQQLNAIRAQLNSQQLRLARSQIIAPDDGIILSRSMNQGQIAGAGQELFRLLRQGRLEWQARVSSADIASIRPQGQVRIDAGKAGLWHGIVRAITPDIHIHTGEAIVYVSLSAGLPDGLFPGMFAQGEFIQGEHNGWSLPHQAVVMRDGQSLVFRVDDQGSVEAVQVAILASQPGRFVVSGVDGKDRIVAPGGEFLNTGDQVRVVSRVRQDTEKRLNE